MSKTFDNLNKCLHAAQSLSLGDKVTFNDIEITDISFRMSIVTISYIDNVKSRYQILLGEDDFDFIIYPANPKRIVLLT